MESEEVKRVELQKALAEKDKIIANFEIVLAKTNVLNQQALVEKDAEWRKKVKLLKEQISNCDFLKAIPRLTKQKEKEHFSEFIIRHFSDLIDEMFSDKEVTNE